MMKVLITTSGLGSRLGNITKYTNKSLTSVGDRPAISHIIDAYSLDLDSYAKDVEFVITLGHFGDHVRQCLEMIYPHKKISFVYVDNFAGEGSSLLYSMSCAKHLLQSPFIFHACDGLVLDLNLSDNDLNFGNFLVGHKANSASQYRTFNVDANNKVISINEKGEINYDYVYIGVAGIKNYIDFWKEVDIILNSKKEKELSDCNVFKEMMKYDNFYYKVFNKWFDIGNVDSLNSTKSYFPSKYDVLDKPEESIYFLGDSVVKFFHDKNICKNRANRAKSLQGLIPKLISSSDNFYQYEFAQGNVLSKCINSNRISDLIFWAKQNLWKEKNVNIDFKKLCYKFYKEKTDERICKFLQNSNIEDKEVIINGDKVDSVKSLLERVDWDWITNSVPSGFHGDFILDNILWNGSFVLLDWRQDFAGNIDCGDVYYDLSKLNHSLVFNHELVNKGFYKIEQKNNEIFCDIHRSHILTLCQNSLWKKVEELNYDLKKVKVLTSIIWLNMSPLHTRPLDKFLYYFGRYNLWRELNEMGTK